MSKTNHDKCHGSCFVMHCMGLSFPGSPFMYLPPPFLDRVSLSHLHPSGKGRGGCSGVRACEWAEVIGFEPTSLKRGEGLVSGQMGVAESESTWGRRKWWW
jgi:hypothetical protein